MKISYNWLRQYINFNESPEEIAALLTSSGLEVESIEPWQSVKGGLEGIIVGEVMQCDKHPGADRLSLCKVNSGSGELLQIVCGAPNVAAGQKVMLAPVGTKLTPFSGEPFEIKKSKIRGEVSEGMLCAEDEVGMGTSHAGLLILPADSKVGSPVADIVGVENDWVLEIGLTPNRADAASHIGVARDIKAVFSKMRETELLRPSVSAFKESTLSCPIEVKVIDDAACPRYSGLYIKGITVKESPSWLQNRLKAVGMRPVNNVVDVTNFVMLETGQPMHAFDAAKIKGHKMEVKQLPANTIFKTLDGAERKLHGTELMICDAYGGMCMAGVFGGIDSGVSEETKELFLESAWFNSVSVRKTARLHGLHTDSSFRFERGTDPEATIYALKRAALLLQEIAGGEVASAIIDIYTNKAQPFSIQLKYSEVEKLIGIQLPPSVIKNIITSLEIKIVNETVDFLDLSVPSFKVDVTRPADVIEEILRIYGYDAIPLPNKMKLSMPSTAVKSQISLEQQTSSYLVAQGFKEIINNSLSRSSLNDISGINSLNIVNVLNPLSNDLNVMRSMMVFSGLDTILYNQNRQQDKIRVFEFGKTYLKQEKGYKETNHLSLWMAGPRFEENWKQAKEGYNIYYLKTILLNIFSGCSLDIDMLTLVQQQDSLFSSSLSLNFRKKELVRFGLLSKNILKKLDLSGEIFYADINFDVFMQITMAGDFTAVEPSRFPEVRRDLSMVLDHSVKYEQLEELAFKVEPKLLKRINLFDIYEGDKIAAGKKSYAISFFLQDEEATLNEKQIDTSMQKLMSEFESKLKAAIRR